MGNRIKSEERILIEAIKAARVVQEYLWGASNRAWGIEEWLRMFRKRLAKLEEVKRDNPHAAVELRKRLLQTAALAIALMAIIEKKGVVWKAKKPIPSNLPQYKKPVKG